MLAVREGFEPPVPNKGYNGFRGRRIRPLCHLTEKRPDHSPRSNPLSAPVPTRRTVRQHLSFLDLARFRDLVEELGLDVTEFQILAKLRQTTA
jgi:hypothetical protein